MLIFIEISLKIIPHGPFDNESALDRSDNGLAPNKPTHKNF